ncbi:MAG: hypothetical protein K0R39_4868 [Symbiobacteriaceae bacterium]|nr:hypothetical protein [Symbiobacteriaceae bacterium]
MCFGDHDDGEAFGTTEAPHAAAKLHPIRAGQGAERLLPDQQVGLREQGDGQVGPGQLSGAEGLHPPGHQVGQAEVPRQPGEALGGKGRVHAVDVRLPAERGR